MHFELALAIVERHFNQTSKAGPWTWRHTYAQDLESVSLLMSIVLSDKGEVL